MIATSNRSLNKMYSFFKKCQFLKNAKRARFGDTLSFIYARGEYITIINLRRVDDHTAIIMHSVSQ